VEEERKMGRPQYLKVVYEGYLGILFVGVGPMFGDDATHSTSV
jgi:hypothetical protein